jgi:hypothetical protein
VATLIFVPSVFALLHNGMKSADKQPTINPDNELSQA